MNKCGDTVIENRHMTNCPEMFEQNVDLSKAFDTLENRISREKRVILECSNYEIADDNLLSTRKEIKCEKTSPMSIKSPECIVTMLIDASDNDDCDIIENCLSAGDSKDHLTINATYRPDRGHPSMGDSNSCQELGGFDSFRKRFFKSCPLSSDGDEEKEQCERSEISRSHNAIFDNIKDLLGAKRRSRTSPAIESIGKCKSYFTNLCVNGY